MTDRCVSRRWLGAAPAVSVVIATHNRAELLPGLIAALRAQTHDDFEVIVVDDASTDDTWAVLREACSDPELRLAVLGRDSNGGPGLARNAGVADARGRWLAFTDDDCLPTPGWLSGLAAAATSGVAVVQGPVDPEPGGWGGPWGRTLHIDRVTGRYETANLACPATDFAAVGGFRANGPVLGKSVGEDLLLGHRLAQRGRVTFAADALVHHRVMPGNYRDHLLQRARLAAFPALTKQAPDLRDEFIARSFLSRRTLAVDAGIAGLAAAAATGRPLLAATAVPWAADCWRSAAGRPGRPRVVRALQWAAADLVGAAALAAGSLRSRSLLL